METIHRESVELNSVGFFQGDMDCRIKKKTSNFMLIEPFMNAERVIGLYFEVDSERLRYIVGYTSS